MHLPSHSGASIEYFDFASLAASAAVALDNMCLGRSVNREPVELLAQKLDPSASESPRFDRALVLALHHCNYSTRESDTGPERQRNAAAVHEGTQGLSARLRIAISDKTAEKGELSILRDLCRELSDNITALQAGIFEEDDLY